MNVIYQPADGKPLSANRLQEIIIERGSQHLKENRAIVFAFIAHSFQDYQLSEVLADPYVIKNFNERIGELITVFFIHRDALSIEGRKAFKRVGKKDSSRPSVVFFQLKDDFLTDFIHVELKSSESFDEALSEIQSLLDATAHSLSETNQRPKAMDSAISNLRRDLEKQFYITSAKELSKLIGPIATIVKLLLSIHS